MSDKNILNTMVDEIATPFYVYDACRIRGNIQRVKEAFKETKIHYSLKANPCLGVCKIISEAGIEAEIASPFEARVAVKAGFKPAGILYDGPGKTSVNIAENLDLGLRRFNIESMTELERLKEITNGNTDDLTLCFRINPLEASNAAEKMTGKPSRFGIDIEELPACLDKAASDGFKINGIHLYLGSQILSDEQLIANYRVGLNIISEHYEKFHTDKKIDYVFGGGFGIPYKDDDPTINLEFIAESFKKLRIEYDLQDKIITRFELGRYIIGNAGRYLAKVVDIKVSRGEKFIILDGGINHFMRYVMTQAKHRISSLNSTSTDLEPAEICGQTCTPYDVISIADMPKDISIGDIIVLEDAGAYGWSMGIQNFLSFPSCAEVVLDKKNFQTVRRKSTFKDLMNMNIN
jgi:diaminopimelate decarboxylase